MSFSRPLSIGALLIVAVMGFTTVHGVAGQETGVSLTVELQEFDDSGISGTAVLTERTDEGTQVSMVLVGAELDGNHPTHIHTGTCDDFNPSPLYPLETVNLSPVDNEGMSETTLDDVELQDLRDGEFVILVHQSPEELTTYLVCGDIRGGTVGAASLDTTGGAGGAQPTNGMPVVGVGSTVEHGLSESSIAFFAAIGLILALAAGVVRRSER